MRCSWWEGFSTNIKNLNVVLNDKSKNRAKILKSNLDRLNFSNKILNKDFLKFNEKEIYEIIIIDTPCSAVGTIRKNPEIFFKKDSPDFNELIYIQEEMLAKAARLVSKGGYIVYMTCSFSKLKLLIRLINS